MRRGYRFGDNACQWGDRRQLECRDRTSFKDNYGYGDRGKLNRHRFDTEHRTESHSCSQFEDRKEKRGDRNWSFNARRSNSKRGNSRSYSQLCRNRRGW